MSDFADPGPNAPTIQSMARSARRRFGSGWEAGKRISFFILLVLVMLVPLGMVEGVIQERAITKAQVAEEIGAQWGPSQTISGPVLVIPYETTRLQTNSDGEQKTIVENHHAVFTPEALRIDAKTGVQKRYKSIYEMLVYGGDVTLSGKFAAPDFATLGVTPSQVGWNSATLVLGISGVRAINSISLQAAGSERQIEAGVLPYHPFAEGV